MNKHCLQIKVYLEDTDAEGIVYHANYLKYIERARTEIFEQRGVSMYESTETGWLFVVHEMHIKFQRSARLGDLLIVKSTAERVSDYRVSFNQEVHRQEDDLPLVIAEVQLVCVDKSGKLIELPEMVEFDS